MRVAQYQELIDLELLKMGAFPAADMTPQLFASNITMPNLTIQVRDDAWTKNPEDAQKNLRYACNKREGNDLGGKHNATLQGRLELLRKISGEGARLLREAYEVEVSPFDALLRDRCDARDSLAQVRLSWVHFIGQRGTDSQITPLRLDLMRPQKHRELVCRRSPDARKNEGRPLQPVHGR